MTQQFPTDSPAPTVVVPVPSAADSGDQPSTADVAKDQATSVGQGAAQAGQHVAAVAKDQTQNVVAEAGNQAKDLLDQARSELAEQAGAQQQRLAQGLHALGDELHSMTQHSDQPGVATDLARQGASRSHDVASWLEAREPGGLLDELKTFARRRPGTFLLAAAGAGLLAGRLTRGVKDATSDNENEQNPVGARAPLPPGALTPTPASFPPAHVSDEPTAGWSGVSEFTGSPTPPDSPLLGDDR